MAKKGRKKTRIKVGTMTPREMALGRADRMTYKQIKRECVIRGMAFDAVVEGDIPTLIYWFSSNYENDINSKLLDEYDAYIQQRMLMENPNLDASMLHPHLRLGYLGEADEEGEVKQRRIKGIPRKKRTRKKKTKQGVYAGTKKALTYQLQAEGINIEETVTKVIETFPEAAVKSIKIWYKRSEKGK